MTQRRRNRHRKRRVGRRAFLIGLGGSVSAALTYYLLRSIPAGNNAEPVPSPQTAPNPALPSGEWRAVWVSYLEFAEMDFSAESAFRADAAALMDNCLSIGLNTVIAQVRPFGDALYRSTLFPWSHLCTGEQGQDPSFDPLDVLITEAHSRGLSLEAWVNPYRLRSSAKMPPALAENNLANVHPEWVCAVGEGLYLNPAIPEAADYVVQGVAELVQNYAVDGIHFDDYFYPTTDPSIDAAQFAASGETDLTAWRRANVTRLVKAAHDSVKAADPTLRFGVSPQGNPDNDRNEQYTDLSVWLTASGADAVVDYLCPQIYWGYGYTLSSGSTRFTWEGRRKGSIQITISPSRSCNVTLCIFPPNASDTYTPEDLISEEKYEIRRAESWLPLIMNIFLPSSTSCETNESNSAMASAWGDDRWYTSPAISTASAFSLSTMDTICCKTASWSASKDQSFICLPRWRSAKCKNRIATYLSIMNVD